MREPVLMVWDFYDGVRSGIALYQGQPHYFECGFDEEEGEHTDVFELWPLDEPMMALAAEQWMLFCAWERCFRAGEVPAETHPGHRGQNARYDEIEDRIKDFLDSRVAPVHRLQATFEPRETQPENSVGPFKALDVTWLDLG